MQDDIVALFAYDRWANRRVLDACRNLTAEQYGAESGVPRRGDEGFRQGAGRARPATR
jgi:hypothetical protein